MNIEITPAFDEKNVSVYCNRCKARTLHKILTNYNSREILDFVEESGEEKTYCIETEIFHQIIECNGCLTVTFREVTQRPHYDELGLPVSRTIGNVIVKYYPERLPDSIVAKNYVGLPIALQMIYNEVIDSYNNGLLILCAAGLRALVETICKELHVNGNNLREKILNLSKSKHLGETTAHSLDIHRFLGNYAMHLGDRPEKEELKTAIKLSEHALDEIYSVPEMKKKLAELLTKRKLEG